MNTYIATCKFGLEAVVAQELKDLGAQDINTANARVFFSGGWDMLSRANLWLRTADRVFMVIGSFPARTFDELFEGVKALPWENYISANAEFPVKGKTAKSQLHSVSDCQSITKKAIVERLKLKYHRQWFEETGKKYIIEVGLLDDVATLALDASGVGLNRRGYRLLNAEAPLAETLASALILISRVQLDRSFWDPMCGSGTIPIEAAMIAQNRAPGLSRSFALEEWEFIPKGIFQAAKAEAIGLVRSDVHYDIAGSDIDGSALDLARQHAKNAGVNIRFFKQDVANITSDIPGGTIICNPPYGERLLERSEAETLYRAMGRAFMSLNGWKYGILTSHPQFERYFGKSADKRRKLYNSSIICQYYQYFYPKR